MEHIPITKPQSRDFFFERTFHSKIASPERTLNITAQACCSNLRGRYNNTLQNDLARLLSKQQFTIR